MQKKENNRILLTGGHAATTALATIEEIVRRGKDTQIYWVGPKRAMEGKKAPSLESTIFPKVGVEFKPIITGRLQRKFSIWTIPSLLRIPFGFIHALILLIKIKPRVILSFGGYAAFPVVFGGWLLRIPIIIHEQTSTIGRANRLSSYFAKKVAISRENSKKYFPRKKTVLVGNPILTQIAGVSQKTKHEDPPVLYITGGSRGSTRINNLVFDALEELLEKYHVVHQTGYVDIKKAEKKKLKLTAEKQGRYEIHLSIDPMQVDGVYKRADVVISRAGANTVSEIIATKRPAILIPIPWSYANEQVENAKFAEKLGVAKVLKQDEVNSQKLLSAIEEMLTKKVEVKDFEVDKKASKKLVDLIEEIVE